MNLRSPSDIDPAALIATVRGVARYQHREVGRGRTIDAITRRSENRRLAVMVRHGLAEQDWPEYRRLVDGKKIPPSEAAGIILRSRRMGL